MIARKEVMRTGSRKTRAADAVLKGIAGPGTGADLLGLVDLNGLDHRGCGRGLKEGKLPAAPDSIRHVLWHAADITQAAEKLRFSARNQINRTASVGARLVLDHLDHAAAHPGHPQRRQRDDRAQKRVRGMKL